MMVEDSRRMNCYSVAQRVLYGKDFGFSLVGEQFTDHYADEIRRWCAKCHAELRYAYAERECYIIFCDKCHTKTLVQATNPASALEKVGSKQ